MGELVLVKVLGCAFCFVESARHLASCAIGTRLGHAGCYGIGTEKAADGVEGEL